MAQIDSILYLGVPGGPPNVTVEVHVPNGSNPNNATSDAGAYVDPSQSGTTVSGAPVVATKVVIAGNVRFANPS